MTETAQTPPTKDTAAQLDWLRVARLVLTSRALDTIEETKLYKEGKVLYQFSARGHDVAQVLLGQFLTHKHDGVGAYYRSRPLLLTLGVSIEDAFAGPLARSGGYSDGRDIGVVCNLPGKLSNGPTVLPMSGDVGSQYTPVAGWAQAVEYRHKQLKDESYAGAIGVVLGGDGGVATNGFWSSLTMATTLQLPMLFYVEDNGYAISVPSDKQTPGQNIAKNLGSFAGLTIIDDDGTDPARAAAALAKAVSHVRARKGPVLIRLTVPRLSGHSGQDTQAYKGDARLAEEKANDPLPKLRAYLLEKGLSPDRWAALESDVMKEVTVALEKALARPAPNTAREKILRHVFAETKADGSPDLQLCGGLWAEGHRFPASTDTPQPEPTRINMVTAIRRTLEVELKTNPKVLIFGEDVGPKGGVHAATLGLHEAFGEMRVFDTSLSEEGIIGRATGMAACGLMPVTEIQFRKYADPATEQLNNCGTIRWRTNNRMCAPIVVRLPGGFFKCGDPWHSVSSEVVWSHGIGWQVCVPSNAEDAVGLLRAAMRSNNPTIFFECRSLLDNAWARRPYPGDSFVLPMGKAKTTKSGKDITIVSWGAMVERCEAAVEKLPQRSVEVIDLRTISPWDRAAVLASVTRTHRCLIVHEDNMTSAFGAEVAAVVTKEAFLSLDAPITRLATPDVPIPYNVDLMQSVLPSVDQIANAIEELVTF
ncbi:MAG: transketolase C-terminal domain-containing protein [Planctomycetota bacterium]